MPELEDSALLSELTFSLALLALALLFELFDGFLAGAVLLPAHLIWGLRAKVKFPVGLWLAASICNRPQLLSGH